MGKTYEEIKAGASTFHTAAIILDTIGKDAMNAKENNLEKRMGHVMIPAIVLKAFCCELWLKALIVKTGKKIKKEHALMDLYLLINQEDRDTIKKNIMNEMVKLDCRYDDTKYERDFQNVSKTFIDWRYFYEKPRELQLSFLESLFTVLSNYVK